MNQVDTSEKRRGNGVIQSGRAELSLEPKVRYPEGWRAGKPEEDPDKVKRWGFLSAKPSEFLIRMRGGQVLTAAQGAACFKFPWDSVAIVPTTIQRLHFTADQVTSEKVGVQVTGLAVYRIAEPLIAFRMLNFSYPERASEKLERMLAEMFVGAVRRLVANLSVEQCLTKRKEGLATELMREIAPVVSGSGRNEDHTQKGWGVVIDTIEIQDVRVLSQQVFANMQARYRQEQERVAREAELHKERALQQGKAEADRVIALARVASETEIREQQRNADEHGRVAQIATEKRVSEAKTAQERALEQSKVESARALALERLEAELEVKRRRQEAEEKAQLEALAAEGRKEEARLAHERAMAAARLQAEVEKLRLEAEAEAAKFEARLQGVQQEVHIVQAQAALAESRRNLTEVELAIGELEERRQRSGQELELSLKRALREIENTVSPEVIQLQVAQQLPQIAAAFQQNMGEVHVTSVDGANPFGYIAAAVEGVMGLARSAGLKVPRPVDESLVPARE